MPRLVYLDNSATTPVHPKVLAAMQETLVENFGNPSASHSLGLAAEKAIRRAREQVAGVLGVAPEEIVFTSGGTEANNLALKGLARALSRRGRHLITTAVEHPSVLSACRQLEKEGFAVTYLPVNGTGLIEPGELVAAIREDTILVSVMHVNNEVGAVQPIETIGRLLGRQGEKVVFHVDAVQSFARLPLKPETWGIDLVSVSAHKIHGPKGAGALYVKRATRLAPIMGGGDQEGGLRPGTENVPGIVGLGVAAALAWEGAEEAARRMRELRHRLRQGIARVAPEARVNGPPQEAAAPHILNVSFGVRAEVLLHSLEAVGIYVSGGSACHSRRPDPSHVLQAMGVKGAALEGAIRFSLSALTTVEDIDYTLDQLATIVPELRRWQTGSRPGARRR